MFGKGLYLKDLSDIIRKIHITDAILVFLTKVEKPRI